MKITVNVDCTPEEARKFFGLPDVEPLQTAMIEDIKERMKANVAALDPEIMFKTWFPTSVDGLEQMQKMFWGQLAAGKKPAGDKSK